MGDGTVDRRRFIGLGIAAAGSATVLGGHAWTARARVSWEAVDGFPDRPNAVVCVVPDLPDGAEIAITITVLGPDPHRPQMELLHTQVVVDGGRARVESVLSYPYQRRVAGEYRYVATASFGGSSIRTSAPATYTLRPWIPFS